MQEHVQAHIHTLDPWDGNKIVREYNQEIPQSQNADKPVAL